MPRSPSTDRRRLLFGLSAFGLVGGPLPPLRAQEGSLYPFPDDRGRQVYNYRVPSDLSVEGLPGIVWAGATHPEVILVEFFDYNCPYCRAAAPDIDAILSAMPTLRLGLVNNPILSAGSLQAAKVQQAVLRSHGPDKAYAFHKAALATHGPIDGPAALDVAAGLGLSRAATETEGDLPQIGAVVKRQAHLADALGLRATPSFTVGATAILGYPGPKALGRALAAVRQCDKLVCAPG